MEPHSCYNSDYQNRSCRLFGWQGRSLVKEANKCRFVGVVSVVAKYLNANLFISPLRFENIGLVMQPVVGVLSDRCTSKLGRRRPFLIVGVTAVVVSFLCLGWCKEIMTKVFGAGYANVSPDPMFIP
jgi:hypothetical protein